MDDYSDALRSAENTLRDFIQEVLAENLGENWIDHCGVTPERIERWRERREEERRKIRGRGIEERLLYYADFYDLPVISKKHWPLFEPCFGKWKTMEVYLEKLEDFRNPDAHRRDLFPYEINLILGITGFIRTAVTNIRSQRKPTDEFFPRFEQVTDSFGSAATPDRKYVTTNRVLHPEDEVHFLAKAWDPKNDACEFRLLRNHFDNLVDWTQEHRLRWIVREGDVGQEVTACVYLRSPRRFHARSSYDDIMSFEYTVLPLE